MSSLRVKNWDTFQHYKDRDPPWIKLHRGLLENYEFCSLPDIAKGHLMLIWCLAARCGNRLPNDAGWIQSRIGASKPVDLEALIAAGFLEDVDPETREKNRAEGWGSRYISAQLREEVLRRGKGVCADCGSAENIEIDHICPVSKGGKSELDNLQLLCRSCNRRKRAKPSSDAKEPAEQVATQTNGSAYSRDRGEGETEERRDLVLAPLGEPAVSDFDRFWEAYPRRTKKANARKAWKAKKPEINAVLSALSWQRKSYDWTKEGGQFVPHPASYLNAEQWTDEPTGGKKQAVVARDPNCAGWHASGKNTGRKNPRGHQLGCPECKSVELREWTAEDRPSEPTPIGEIS